MTGIVARRADEITRSEPEVVPADLLPTIEAFTHVDVADRHFQFRAPLRARREYVDGIWVYEVVDYGIVAPGLTREAARTTLASCVAALWDGCAQAEPEGLTDEAQQLAQRLRDAIEVTGGEP